MVKRRNMFKRRIRNRHPHGGHLFELVLFAFVLFWASPLLASNMNESAKNQTRFNILVLLTDDQDVELGSFDTQKYMPKLHRHLREEGVTFEKGGFVHVPICCPSRSSLLTGRYLHHGNGGLARNNSISGNCYGPKWIELMEANNTFAVHAKDAGYTTLYAGKYLNQYTFDENNPRVSIPEGWDYWYGLEGNSRYYNYSIVEYQRDAGGPSTTNTTRPGQITRHNHGDKYPQDYLPLVLQNYTLSALEKMPEPWLAVIAWPTPHGPFTPEPKFSEDYPDVQAPRTPNYNASSSFQKQKHWLLRQLGIIQNSTAEEIDEIYKNRLRTLETVDNHIEALIQQLDKTAIRRSPNDSGEMFNERSRTSMLDRTFVVFTSDNGFQFGQHRLAIDKRHLYEHDVRVPFVVRTPKGIGARNITVSKERIISTIDIAPTILDIILEGMSIREQQSEEGPIFQNDTIGHTVNKIQSALKQMDGLSFWKFLHRTTNTKRFKSSESRHLRKDAYDPFVHRSDLLISYHGEGNPKCGFSECPPPLNDLWWMPDSFNNSYHCLRTLTPASPPKNSIHNNKEYDKGEDTIYCVFYDDENFVEYYDLQTNPFQLENDYSKLTSFQIQRYEKRLKELLT